MPNSDASLLAMSLLRKRLRLIAFRTSDGHYRKPRHREQTMSCARAAAQAKIVLALPFGVGYHLRLFPPPQRLEAQRRPVRARGSSEGTAVQQTPASLLERLRQPEGPAAWERFVFLYTPLLCHWAR